MSHSHTQAHMEEDIARVIAVVSYLTLVGWIISLFIYGQHKSCLARFHLRQALGLIVCCALLSLIPFIGWLLTIVVVFYWFVAIYHAYKGECYPVPLFGQFFQEHLDFIA